MVKNEGEDWKAYSSLGQQIVSMIFFHKRKGFLVQFRSGSGDEPEDMSEKLETTVLATNPQLPPSFKTLLEAQTYSCRPYPHVHIHIVYDTSIPKQFTEVYLINKHLTLLYLTVLPIDTNQWETMCETSLMHFSPLKNRPGNTLQTLLGLQTDCSTQMVLLCWAIYKALSQKQRQINVAEVVP